MSNHSLTELERDVRELADRAMDTYQIADRLKVNRAEVTRIYNAYMAEIRALVTRRTIIDGVEQ